MGEEGSFEINGAPGNLLKRSSRGSCVSPNGTRRVEKLVRTPLNNVSLTSHPRIPRLLSIILDRSPWRMHVHRIVHSPGQHVSTHTGSEALGLPSCSAQNLQPAPTPHFLSIPSFQGIKHNMAQSNFYHEIRIDCLCSVV